MAQSKQMNTQAQLNFVPNSELIASNIPALAQIETLVSSLVKEIGELRQALTAQTTKVDHLEQQLVRAKTTELPASATTKTATAIEVKKNGLVTAPAALTQSEEATSITSIPTSIPVPNTSPTPNTSRRNLLKRMGMVAAGLAAATTAATTLNPNSAQAASGDVVLLGNSNIASNTTHLSQTNGTATLDKNSVLLLDFNSTGVSSNPSINTAIAGVSDDASALAVGGYFRGKRAAIFLEPQTTPTTGSHSVGELYVDNAGDLYIYKSSGWAKISGGTTAGNYVTLSPSTPDNGNISISGNITAGLSVTAGYEIRANNQFFVGRPGGTAGIRQYYDPNPTQPTGLIQCYDSAGGATKALVIVGSSIALGGGPVSVTNNLSVTGSFTAATKSFEIPHPDTTKTDTTDLRHCVMEAPTRGDTVYRFNIKASKARDIVKIDLPDYWQHLNENPQVWINGNRHFGHAYGEVNKALTSLTITCETAGDYNVLLIGTRKDEVAKAWWDERGVEKKVSEEWTTPDNNLKASNDRTSEIVRAIKNKNKEPKPSKP